MSLWDINELKNDCDELQKQVDRTRDKLVEMLGGRHTEDSNPMNLLREVLETLEGGE